jgi:hypothetical protein
MCTRSRVVLLILIDNDLWSETEPDFFFWVRGVDKTTLPATIEASRLVFGIVIGTTQEPRKEFSDTQ